MCCGHLHVAKKQPSSCSTEGSDVCTKRQLYIANIPYDTDVFHFYDVIHRETNGTLEEMRIFSVPGRVYVFATLHSDDGANAVEAVRRINGMEYNGRWLVCALSQPSRAELNAAS